MSAFWNENVQMPVQEIEILETELALLIRKIKQADLYYSDRVERVLRAVKRQEVIENSCSRVCQM